MCRWYIWLNLTRFCEWGAVFGCFRRHGIWELTWGFWAYILDMSSERFRGHFASLILRRLTALCYWLLDDEMWRYWQICGSFRDFLIWTLRMLGKLTIQQGFLMCSVYKTMPLFPHLLQSLYLPPENRIHIINFRITNWNNGNAFTTFKMHYGISWKIFIKRQRRVKAIYLKRNDDPLFKTIAIYNFPHIYNNWWFIYITYFNRRTITKYWYAYFLTYYEKWGKRLAWKIRSKAARLILDLNSKHQFL